MTSISPSLLRRTLLSCWWLLAIVWAAALGAEPAAGLSVNLTAVTAAEVPAGLNFATPATMAETARTGVAMAGRTYAIGPTALVRKGTNDDWQPVADSPAPWSGTARLLYIFDRWFIVGEGLAWSYHPREGWRTSVPPDGQLLVWRNLGEAHAVALVDSPRGRALALFHGPTQRWTTLSTSASAASLAGAEGLAVQAGTVWVQAGGSVLRVTLTPPPNNYGWLDHAVVILYLAGMLGLGFVFLHQEKSGRGYFGGNHKLPWWALGMSLFATAASAISLMAMPAKAFTNDWTYFAISIAAVLTLPFSLYLIAPLVRRLRISTSNEYLDRRFGPTARVLGSLLFSANQILARTAPVIFLPAIAMSAVTGVPVEVWIIAIGLVTTFYTYVGGLAAVVWSDTIQGFVMVGTVVGCFLLVVFQLDIPWAEAQRLLSAQEKLHVLDLEWDTAYPTFWMILIGSIVGSLAGITDQNYVQRVQAARDLNDTRKAVVTQLAVAVPLNAVLFALGTALFLYYQQHPAQLNPLMKSEGVYPHFAAQHLPPGFSGLVIAALLAASMSTISSAICSVANLGVDDFIRRFRPSTTDQQALWWGRGFTAALGLLGTVSALILAKSDSKSLWDMALLITGLIGNGVVGFFALGLLTRRAHEVGALVGIAAGMGVVIYLQQATPTTVWLYALVGSSVTLVVGYLASLVLPGPKRDLTGLTVFNLPRTPSP